MVKRGEAGEPGVGTAFPKTLEPETSEAALTAAQGNPPGPFSPLLAQVREARKAEHGRAESNLQENRDPERQTEPKST